MPQYLLNTNILLAWLRWKELKEYIEASLTTWRSLWMNRRKRNGRHDRHGRKSPNSWRNP
jgi:hypothetical protein